MKAVAKITTGDKDTKDRVENGLYPFFVRSQTVERINSVGFDGEGVLTAGDGVGTGKIFHYINGKCDFHQRVYLMHSFSEGVTGRYFFYYFSHFFYDRIMAMTAKSSVDSVRREMIADMEILFPKDSREQERVVAALSDADGVVAGLERVIAKRRLIKQGAMQDLLTARRRLPGFSGEWEEATISDVAHADPEALGAGTPKDYAFRYISLEDVNQGVLSGWTDVAFRSAPSRARRILQKNDVLLGTVRPNLKSHMLFDRLGADWVGSTGFAVLRPRPEKCISGYLFELIMSDVIGRQIDEVIAGSNYPAISNSDVRKLKVLLPSVDEQKAIAAVLRDMDAEIQTLESRLAKARAVKEGMMQNLLTGRVRLV